MKLTRREALAIGAGTFVAAGFGVVPAYAGLTEDAIAAFTGGAEIVEGGVDLTAPEIAENGNTVPVEVSAEGATSIIIVAPSNPLPVVVRFNFGPLSGSRSASTRIRLAKTQDVMAIAMMEDGTFRSASSLVKVTIGGCGG